MGGGGKSKQRFVPVSRSKKIEPEHGSPAIPCVDISQATAKPSPVAKGNAAGGSPMLSGTGVPAVGTGAPAAGGGGGNGGGGGSKKGRRRRSGKSSFENSHCDRSVKDYSV